MSKSRRQFLLTAAMGSLAAAVAPKLSSQEPAPATPGAPPAFGTAPPVGPEVSVTTFAEAEKLVQVQMSDAERAEAAGNWRSAMAPIYELRTGPRRVHIESADVPYSLWNPVLPGEKAGPARNQFVWSKPIPARFRTTTKTLLSHRSPAWRTGSKLARSLRSG